MGNDLQITENLSAGLVPSGGQYRHLTGPAGVGLLKSLFDAWRAVGFGQMKLLKLHL
jgi:hypothetical protein